MLKTTLAASQGEVIMPLKAVLTVGWPEVNAEDRASAVSIHKRCEQDQEPERYKVQLLTLLQELGKETDQKKPLCIKGVEKLFRRQISGFSRVQWFVGQLNDVVTANPILDDVHCEIDVFAYAFLKGAKNFDLFLPEVEPKQGPFRDIYPKWKERMDALMRFERDGIKPPQADADAYVALRRILFRPTTRDEQRTLIMLLVNGPSTSQEITRDLDLPYSLGARILPMLEEIKVLAHRGVGEYAIRSDALPRVVFCLREAMGFDLLPILERES
jgi:hypothetical protein